MNEEPKIITWNLGKALCATETPWTEEIVCKTLSQEDADVVFLQEVPCKDRELAFKSKEWAELTFYYQLHHPKLGGNEEYCLVTMIRNDGANNYQKANIYEQKDNKFVRIFAIFNENKLYVNVHLFAQSTNNNRNDDRIIQCEALGCWLKSHKYKSTIVICGDLNASVSSGVQELVSAVNENACMELILAENLHKFSKIYWLNGYPDLKENDFIITNKKYDSYCLFNDPIPVNKIDGKNYLNAHFPVVNYNTRIVRIETDTYNLDSLIPTNQKPKPLVYSGDSMSYSNCLAGFLYQSQPYLCHTKPPSAFAVGFGLECDKLSLGYFGDIYKYQGEQLDLKWKHVTQS